MNKDEMMIDRYYDELYSKYTEGAKVPYESYEELEEEYEHLKCVIKDVAIYLRENDPAGAYEYLKSEDLV